MPEALNATGGPGYRPAVLCAVGCDREGCTHAIVADASEMASEFFRLGWVHGRHPVSGKRIQLCPSCVASLEARARPW